jgi:hypothetical protein
VGPINQPNPTSLDIHSVVWYRGHRCEVRATNQENLYMIQSLTNSWRIWWVRPDQVQVIVGPPERNGHYPTLG